MVVRVQNVDIPTLTHDRVLEVHSRDHNGLTFPMTVHFCTVFARAKVRVLVSGTRARAARLTSHDSKPEFGAFCFLRLNAHHRRCLPSLDRAKAEADYTADAERAAMPDHTI